MLEELQGMYATDNEKFKIIIKLLLETTNKQLKKEFEQVLLHLYLLHGEELGELFEEIEEQRKWDKIRETGYHPIWTTDTVWSTTDSTKYYPTTWIGSSGSSGSATTNSGTITFDDTWYVKTN